MNIKHVWSVLCRESVISQDDNNISIHGVFEQLAVSVAPQQGHKEVPEKISIPISYEIVSMWVKDHQKERYDGEIEYIFLDPKGKELLKTSQKIEIATNVKRHRTRMKISGMPLTISGDYILKVSLRENGKKLSKPICELPLEVTIKKEAPKTNNLPN